MEKRDKKKMVNRRKASDYTPISLLQCFDRLKGSSSASALDGALEGEPCVFIHLLIQQYLLSVYFVLITVLGDRDRAANKTNRNLYNVELGEVGLLCILQPHSALVQD